MTASSITSALPGASAGVQTRTSKKEATAPLGFAESLHSELARHDAANPPSPVKKAPESDAENGPAASKQETAADGSNGPHSGNKQPRKSPSRTADITLGQVTPGLMLLPIIAQGTDANLFEQNKSAAVSPAAQHSHNELALVDSTTPPAAPSSSADGSLALAMKIRPADAEPATSNAQAAEILPVSETPGDDGSKHTSSPFATIAAPQVKQDAEVPPMAAPSIGTDAGFSAKHSDTAPAEIPKPVPSAAFEAELHKIQTEPLRSAHVQIEGSGTERVNIRLLERGGALSVSIRSADTVLTKALQEHTTELASRLSAEHFRTELWTPNSGKQSQEQPDGQGQSRERQQQGSSEGDTPRRRQNQNQKNDPAWVEAFERTPAAFQKRINYAWHP